MKKKLIKALSMMLISSLAITSFVGCGKKEEAKADKDVTLEVWLTPQWKGFNGPNDPNADYDSFYKHVAEEYTKKHPNVKVNVQVVSAAERDEKLNVNLSAGKQPDIFFEATFAMKDFAHRGALVPLDDIIDDQSKSDIAQGIWDSCKVGGKTFFYPFTQSPCFLGINADIFKKAGAEKFLPQEGTIGTWSIDEFEQALKAISTVDGIYPLSLYAGSTEADTWNNIYLRMFGGKFFNEDNTKITINSPEGVKALEFLKKLSDEKLTQPSVGSTKSGDALNMFKNGKIGVNFINHALGNMIKADMDAGKLNKFDIRYVNIPGLNQPMNFSYVQGSAVFDTGDDTRIKYAKDFVKFYSTEADCTISSKNLVPVRKSVVEKVKNETPIFTEYEKNSKYLVEFTGGIPGYVEMRNLLFPQLQSVFTGQKTPQQALDDFASQGNKALDKNYKDSTLKKK